ncbi:MAG: alpha/beta fold hydrolase [Chloroflexi bacterium]|nr:alpha/beta fold hydrolase [Chloroflexota bacterium]
MHLEVITRRPEGAPRPTPLLFVHGAWHGAWCWDEYFLPYFAQHGYEAHALSLRGHGKSAGRVRWASVVDYVNDVEQVARSFDKLPVLIGHSMGGYVVQKYLESRRAPAAVLLAPVPVVGIFPATVRYGLRHPLALLKTGLKLDLYPLVGTPALSRDTLFSRELPDTQVLAYHERLQSESFRFFLDSSLLNLPRPAGIHVPVLVLAAAQDRVFTRREQERTARAYHTQAEFFPVAHDMMLEPGWQAVADRIIVWLNGKGL